MADHRLLICPYCGETQPESDRCRACAGLFEPLSRQATHNSMGPWFIRNDQRPHQPGCSYETLVKLIQRGRVTRYTIVRGPTTRQFWTIAKRVPGISHFFGACYQCDASVDTEDRSCHACGATFGGFLDRNFLGLPEFRPLPWEADQTGQRRSEIELGEPSDWRQQTAAASGMPRGISSFATDEELLGEVPETSGMTGDTVPATEGGMTGLNPEDTSPSQASSATAVDLPEPEPDGPEPQSVSQPDPHPTPSPDACVNDATGRALRRQLARQQRTIRVLAYTCIGVAAIAIVIGLLWNDLRSTVTAPNESKPDQTAVSDDEWELPGLVPSQPTPKQPSAIVPADEWLDDEPTKAETFSGEHQMAYDEAVHLIGRAAVGDRDLSERIADLERAVNVMERLKRDVSESALPDDFSDTLIEARRTLERLRIREFFP